jgi:hypothetical protein
MQGSPLKFNRHFGGISRLYLQIRIIYEIRNEPDRRWQACNVDVLLKRRSTLNGLHGFISQKM